VAGISSRSALDSGSELSRARSVSRGKIGSCHVTRFETRCGCHVDATQPSQASGIKCLLIRDVYIREKSEFNVFTSRFYVETLEL